MSVLTTGHTLTWGELLKAAANLRSFDRVFVVIDGQTHDVEGADGIADLTLLVGSVDDSDDEEMTKALAEFVERVAENKMTKKAMVEWAKELEDTWL